MKYINIGLLTVLTILQSIQFTLTIPINSNTAVITYAKGYAEILAKTYEEPINAATLSKLNDDVHIVIDEFEQTLHPSTGNTVNDFEALRGALQGVGAAIHEILGYTEEHAYVHTEEHDHEEETNIEEVKQFGSALRSFIAVLESDNPREEDIFMLKSFQRHVFLVAHVLLDYSAQVLTLHNCFVSDQMRSLIDALATYIAESIADTDAAILSLDTGIVDILASFDRD